MTTDPRALVERAFHTWSPAILSYLWRLVGDRDEAEALCQDVFFRLLRAAPTFPNDLALKTWLYRVARNLAFDDTRKMRPKLAAELPDGEDVRPGPPQSVQAAEDVMRLHAALAQLPPLYRHTLTLRFLEELDYSEIAAIEGVTESALRTRVQTGVSLLRDLLGIAPQTEASRARS